MKIKLTQAGYENFTGLFGNHHFDNGICADLPIEAFSALGATVQCEEVTDDVPVMAATEPAFEEQPVFELESRVATEVATEVETEVETPSTINDSEVAKVTPEV